MVRFLLIAMLATAIGAFLIILRIIPEPTANPEPQPKTQAAKADSAKHDKSNKAKLATQRSGAAKHLNSQSPEVQSQMPNSGSLESADAADNTESDSQTTAKHDAAIYSSNSARTGTVGVLKRGEPVESSIEVLDPDGRWTLVRGAAQNRQGFVRTESLERHPTKP